MAEEHIKISVYNSLLMVHNTTATEESISKLGLTPEMQRMCSMFGDEKFMALGLAFRKSGDDLGNVLRTKDANASLRALNKTMHYCGECHASYRQ